MFCNVLIRIQVCIVSMAPTLIMVVVNGNTGLSLCPTTNGPVSQFIQHLFQLSLGVISGVLEWTIDYHNQLRADKWTVDTLLPPHTTTATTSPATLCTAQLATPLLSNGYRKNIWKARAEDVYEPTSAHSRVLRHYDNH